MKEWFGYKDCIIYAHIQELSNPSVSVNTKSRIAALWKLQGYLKAHVYSLDAIGVNGMQYCVTLTPSSYLTSHETSLRMSSWGRGSGEWPGLVTRVPEQDIHHREWSATFRKSSSVGKADMAAREKYNVNRLSPLLLFSIRSIHVHSVAFTMSLSAAGNWLNLV